MSSAGRVRIEDLANPRLRWPARALNLLSDRRAASLLPLDERTLLAAARARTGLDDFGSGDFLEPLRMILEDLQRSEPLSPLGRLTARSILAQLLDARLCVEDRVARDPSILGRPLPRPIVIIGLPRTGTTHLHNLLSQIGTLRHLPLWESVNPLRPPRARWRPDTRRLANGLRMGFIDYLLPWMRKMHEMEPDLPHEELQLSAIGFRSFFFEGSFRLPTYQPWYASRDNSDGYRYLRRVLQVLTHGGGPDRWVLKSPQHLDQLPALLAAFPDARIVRTHREPAEVVASLVTMISYSRRVCYRQVDPRREAREWTDRLEKMLRASVEQQRDIDPARVLDVSFEELLHGSQGVVERVLRFADVEASPHDQQAMAAYVAAHPHGRLGRVAYDLEPLGLDPAALRERFAFYGRQHELGARPRPARRLERHPRVPAAAGSAVSTPADVSPDYS